MYWGFKGTGLYSYIVGCIEQDHSDIWKYYLPLLSCLHSPNMVLPPVMQSVQLVVFLQSEREGEMCFESRVTSGVHCVFF